LIKAVYETKRNEEGIGESATASGGFTGGRHEHQSRGEESGKRALVGGEVDEDVRAGRRVGVGRETAVREQEPVAGGAAGVAAGLAFGGGARPRLQQRVVDAKARASLNREAVWGELSSFARAAFVEGVGLQPPAAAAAGAGARRRGGGMVREEEMAGAKKKAWREKKSLVLMDESGFMLQPVSRKTWALRGRRPVHKSWDRHERLSALGALTLSPRRERLGFYFWFRRNNICGEDVEAFVTDLRRQLGRDIILVWDRLSAHRAAATALKRKLGGKVQFEWLPAYAPELNPVEQVWSNTKYGELANFIPDDLEHLRQAVSQSLNAKRTQQHLLRSFFKHAELYL